MPPSQSRSLARRRMFRRRRLVVGAGLLLICGLLVAVGLRVSSALPLGRAAAAVDSSPASRTPKPKVISAPLSASSGKAPASPSPSATTSAPRRSSGVYDVAPGGTDRYGSGTLVTYRVEVEDGIGQSASAFAAAVDATLADPSSWTGQGRWSLQRAEGRKVDFVIRLATPASVDKVCATAGLDTQGFVSCRAGQFVMINLDRWLLAVPDYRGDVARYRHYVINHEVGHQLGYSHQACPGPGRLAPVMQQQTFGLNGCLANGWPFVDGVFVSGPGTL